MSDYDNDTTIITTRLACPQCAHTWANIIALRIVLAVVALDLAAVTLYIYLGR